MPRFYSLSYRWPSVLREFPWNIPPNVGQSIKWKAPRTYPPGKPAGLPIMEPGLSSALWFVCLPLQRMSQIRHHLGMRPPDGSRFL